jgi:hypothetical protein
MTERQGKAMWEARIFIYCLPSLLLATIGTGTGERMKNMINL